MKGKETRERDVTVDPLKMASYVCTRKRERERERERDRENGRQEERDPRNVANLLSGATSPLHVATLKEGWKKMR